MGLPSFLNKTETAAVDDFDRIAGEFRDIGDEVRKEVESIIVKTNSQLAEEALSEFAAIMADTEVTVENAVRKIRNALPGLRQKLTEELAAIQAKIAKIDARMATLPKEAEDNSAPSAPADADKQAAAPADQPAVQSGVAVEAK